MDERQLQPPPFQLRPHQLAADAKWCECESERRCFGLFDAMGLGKTRTALYHFHGDQDEGRTRRTLVVCPASIRGQWRDEVKKFGLDDVVRVVSYAAIGRRTKTYAEVMGTSWHRVALDEAHYLGQYRTNRHGAFVGTGRARACRAVRATHRVAITGTPCFSSARSYRAIASFLRCGEQELPELSIRRRVADLPDVAPFFPVIHATEHDIDDARYTERHGKDVEQYVEKVLGRLTDDSTDEERAAWKKRAPMHRRIGNEIGSLSLGLLRPDRGAPVAAHHQPKVELVCQLVGRRDNRNILLFTTFRAENTHIANTLRRRFGHRSVFSITGDTPLDTRDRIFKSAASANHYRGGGTRAMHQIATACLRHTWPPVGLATMHPTFPLLCSFLEPVGAIVVAQIDTCAVGLNLKWAQTAIFPRPGWSLRQEHQAVCRMRRMQTNGTPTLQTKDVHFIFIGRDAAAAADADDDDKPNNTFVDARITKARMRKKHDAETTLGEDDCSPWPVLNQVTWHNEFSSL